MEAARGEVQIIGHGCVLSKVLLEIQAAGSGDVAQWVRVLAVRAQGPKFGFIAMSIFIAR